MKVSGEVTLVDMMNLQLLLGNQVKEGIIETGTKLLFDGKMFLTRYEENCSDPLPTKNTRRFMVVQENNRFECFFSFKRRKV